VGSEEAAGAEGSRAEQATASGQAQELPARGGPDEVGAALRTPLFQAQHSERYARQSLIDRYEGLTGANLIDVIDQIFPENLTLLEELLFDLQTDRPLHVLLASPGGDGETAIRMVRSMQIRCSELSMLVPDMAKSAATLMRLGAHEIVMGPGGDLGPVDPQFQIGGRSLASAKEIVAAVAEAEEHVRANPDVFPLYAGLPCRRQYVDGRASAQCARANRRPRTRSARVPRSAIHQSRGEASSKVARTAY
jgi:hypothetical protein